MNRRSRFFEDDVPSFSDDSFRDNFRVSRTVFNWLLDRLKPGLQRQNTVMRVPIAGPKRLAIALYTLTTTAEFRTIGNLFDVSKASVRLILREFIRVMVTFLVNDFIKMPPGADLQAVVDGFL